MNFKHTYILLFVCMTGCSYISGPEGLFPDTSKDFFDETISDDIDLSGTDLMIDTDNHYPVLESSEFQTEPLDIPRPRQIFSSGQTKQVQLRRLGELLWVYVEALPSTSWPITKSFLETSNYNLINADPETGIILVEYERDILMKIAVEHGIKEASTEVFMSFQSKDGSELTDDLWVDKSQEELKLLVQYMADSVDSFSGTSLAAQALNDKKKTRIFNLEDETVIELDLGFDRAWSAVSRALEEGKIITNDKNRAEGFFLVSYVDSDDEGGWFSFLNFRSEDSSSLELSGDADYKIIVKMKGKKTNIYAESLKSDNKDAEALLSKINELLS